MLTGISTACFYPQHTEDSLRTVVGLPGVQCAEVFLNASSELEHDYLKEMRRIADDAGVRISSIHPYASAMEPLYFFSHYDRRFEEGLRLYRKFFEAARILGADLVVFHGNTRFSRMIPEEYCERFHRIWEVAAGYGVELCQENVERCLANDHSFFEAMAEYLPHVGYVLDIKQAARAKQDVFELAAVMGENLRHIHISDNDLFHSCMLPGRGSFNFEKLFRQVRSRQFDGQIILELYSQDFRDSVELVEGYQHVLDIVSTRFH